MTALVILCVAAFAMAAVPLSGVAHIALPWLDRLAMRIAPRHRVRLWLGVAALPTLVGLLAVTASFLPAVGIGHDHCLAHGPHHPHLCPHHMGAAPGIALVLIAVLLAERVAHVLAELIRSLHLSRATSGTLAEASELHDGVLVFPSDEPQAFVLGTLRPRVHISRGLLALGRDIVAAVVAHERVHARHRDLLWRALCPVFAVGHLPATTTAIRARLAAAQEMAADEEAADAMPEEGRLKIAEALVMLAKLARTPSPAISFTHGDLQSRVRALLDGRRHHPRWPARLLLATLLLVPALVGASHDFIHHGLETLLGALS
jgi:hypothetical protein